MPPVGTRQITIEAIRELLGHTRAHGRVEDIAEASLLVEQALTFTAEELLFRPELLRLRGEVHLSSGSDSTSLFESAEGDFRAAIDAARKMNAKSDELRAAMSLARVLRDTNRRDEACTTLASVYGWFTEGFGTNDLQKAKLLLDELQ